MAASSRRLGQKLEEAGDDRQLWAEAICEEILAHQNSQETIRQVEKSNPLSKPIAILLWIVVAGVVLLIGTVVFSALGAIFTGNF